jgi:hypothetical protein
MVDSERRENDFPMGLEPVTTHQDALLHKREVVKATRAAPLERTAAFRGACVAAAAATAAAKQEAEAEDQGKEEDEEANASRSERSFASLTVVPAACTLRRGRKCPLVQFVLQTGSHAN